jgi:hypothetical protein
MCPTREQQEQLATELRELSSTRELSDEFYSLYVAFKDANKTQQLTFFALAHGGVVPERTHRVVEQQARPLPRCELLKSLLACEPEERLGLLEDILDTLREASSPAGTEGNESSPSHIASEK